MRKTLVALAAAAAGLIVAFAPTAANAYPDPVITSPGGSAADGVVAPGEAFTLSGSFDGVDCSPWNANFLGQGIGSGAGPTFSVSATAPTEPGTYPLTISCTYDDGTTAPAAFAPVAFTPGDVIQTTTLTYQIRVASDAGAGSGSGSGSGSSNGVLPETGGPNVALLAAGGALLVAGGAVVVARRRTAA